MIRNKNNANCTNIWKSTGFYPFEGPDRKTRKITPYKSNTMYILLEESEKTKEKSTWGKAVYSAFTSYNTNDQW